MLDFTSQVNELKTQAQAIVSNGNNDSVNQKIQQLLSLLQNGNGSENNVSNIKADLPPKVEIIVENDNSVFNTAFNIDTRSGVAKISSGKKKDSVIAFQNGVIVKSYSKGYESDKFANGTFDLSCGYTIRLFKSRITAIVPIGQEFLDKKVVKTIGEVTPLIQTMLNAIGN